MHNKFELVLLGMLLRPTDDELLRIMIQIPLVEGGWIHGIEQLVQFHEFHLDESCHDCKRNGKTVSQT